MTDDERAGVEILGRAYREIVDAKMVDNWRDQGDVEANTKAELVAVLVELAKLQARFEQLPLALAAIAGAHEVLMRSQPDYSHRANRASSALRAGMVRVGVQA